MKIYGKPRLSGETGIIAWMHFERIAAKTHRMDSPAQIPGTPFNQLADYPANPSGTLGHFKADLVAEAEKVGFVAFGVTPAATIPLDGERLMTWLGEKRHGSMEWMETRAHQRRAPQALWPEAQSVIVLGMSYAPAIDPMQLASHPEIGRICSYAQGADYHDTLKKALKALARWMVAETEKRALGPMELKVFTDTAPVMEKPLAARGGIGWQGRHTNLVSRDHGSWLLLGEIYTTLLLPPDKGEVDHCGSCMACQDACPTQAFITPYRLDATRCISYLTIEYKGPIPHELRKAIGNRIYGCDDCLAACPWNKFAQTAHAHQAYLPRAELAAPRLADLLALDDATFRKVFSGSPVKRIGRDRMVRNCLIAAGNSGDHTLLPLVQGLCNDPDPVVAEAARWAVEELLKTAL